MCFAALSPAFLNGALQGCIDKRVQWSKALFQSHLSSSPGLRVFLRLKLTHSTLLIRKGHAPLIKSTPVWAQNDLLFVAGTRGLPWQTPAASEASLHMFLEACVWPWNLYAPSNALTTVTTTVWPPQRPTHFFVGSKTTRLGCSFQYCSFFGNLVAKCFMKPSWSCQCWSASLSFS